MAITEERLSTLAKLKKDIFQAVKDRLPEKAESLKYLLSLLEKESLKKERVTETDLIKVLLAEKKRKHEAVELFQRGNRPDLVEKEKREAELLENYLPSLPSEEEIKSLIRKAVDEKGTNFGVIMKTVMEQTGGLIDGASVSRLVGEEIKVKGKQA